MSDYLLGIDIGTTACKTVLFDFKGRAIVEASTEYSVLYPKPDWAEQNPDVWWNATRANIRRILRKLGNSEKIVGIGVASQREAIVPIDSRGNALGNSLIWLDRRSIPQTRQIADRLSRAEVIEITGMPVNYFYSAPKILWLREERPRLYAKTVCLLPPKDYVTFKITGQRATDPSMASRTMLFDIARKEWSDKICNALKIEISLLPTVISSSDVVGEVTSRSASITGLRPGTPVVSGGGDRPCESIGAGITKPGQFNIGTGTATCMTTPLMTPRVDPKGHIDCCCHVIPNMWEYEIVIITTGASFRWFRDTFGSEEVQRSKKTGVDPYVYLNKLAAHVKAGSDGLLFYPYPMGSKVPKFNDDARGVYFGITLTHRKGHFVRALYEGIAFQYVEAMGLAKELGIKVREASIVGGEARSDLWNQIKTDVIRRSIKRPKVEDAAALGSAILSSVGTGVYRTVGKAVNEMVNFERRYRPRTNAVDAYRTAFERYKVVYKVIERGYKVR